MEDLLITRIRRPRLAALRTGLRRLGREKLGVYRGMFVKHLFQWPLRAAFRGLSRFVNRQPNLIVFGSVRNRLADNSAYLFLAMARDEELRCVWISGSHKVVQAPAKPWLRGPPQMVIAGNQSRCSGVVLRLQLCDVRHQSVVG